MRPQLILKVLTGQAVQNRTETAVDGQEEVGHALEHQDPEGRGIAVIAHSGLVLPDADALVEAEDEADRVADDEEEGDGQQDVGLARLLGLQLGGAGVAGLERERELGVGLQISRKEHFCRL